MHTFRRTFHGEADLEAMSALARAYPAAHLHTIDLPYRFSSWALDDAANTALWFTPDGRLVAWAVLQAPFWAVDHARQPDVDEGLGREVWAWADARARALAGTPGGRPAWFVNVFSGQQDLIRELEASGFTCQTNACEDSWSKVWMRRPAELPAQCPVPTGHTIRPLAGEGEVAAYAELQREVFGTQNMTAEWRSRTLRRPEYIPDLDLVAEAPGGRLAAFCIGWLDRHHPEGPAAQIEPMGVREEMRHLGLGRAILSETLKRLAQHGAGHIYVETDSYRDAALELYEAVGFRVIREVLVYRKDYEE